MGRNKVSPISTPSVAMAVIADEENVIPTKNDNDAPREDDEIEMLTSTSKWTICLVAGLIVLAAVVTISAAIPMTNNRETDVAALQMTYDSIDQIRQNPTEIPTSPDRSAITTISATSSTSPALTTTTTSLEEEDATSAAATTTIVSNTSTTSTATTVISTSTSAVSTTTTSITTTSAENSSAGIDLLVGTKWKALEIRWLKGSLVEELKETTEDDRNPITLFFDSDSSVSGTCGNNRCWNSLVLKSDRLSLGIFRRTRMRASEQENNYVFLLQQNAFLYEVQDDEGCMPKLHLYEIITKDGVDMRGRLMATYVKLSEEESV